MITYIQFKEIISVGSYGDSLMSVSDFYKKCANEMDDKSARKVCKKIADLYRSCAAPIILAEAEIYSAGEAYESFVRAQIELECMLGHDIFQGIESFLNNVVEIKAVA